jgi:hypothetical protein
MKPARNRARRLPDLALLLGLALTATACGNLGKRAPADPLGDRGVSAVERSANPPVLTQHLDAVQKLLTAEPVAQAELLDNARRDAESSRLASARLRHALLLATSGHAGFDPVAAVVILKDILAVPATLPPAERALAMVELQRITNDADLSSENQRLRQQLERMEKEQLASLSRRLQAESEENTRLRKALDEARAKLDAIGKIETGDVRR